MDRFLWGRNRARTKKIAGILFAISGVMAILTMCINHVPAPSEQQLHRWLRIYLLAERSQIMRMDGTAHYITRDDVETVREATCERRQAALRLRSDGWPSFNCVLLFAARDGFDYVLPFQAVYVGRSKTLSPLAREGYLFYFMSLGEQREIFRERNAR